MHGHTLAAAYPLGTENTASRGDRLLTSDALHFGAREGRRLRCSRGSRQSGDGKRTEDDLYHAGHGPPFVACCHPGGPPGPSLGGPAVVNAPSAPLTGPGPHRRKRKSRRVGPVPEAARFSSTASRQQRPARAETAARPGSTPTRGEQAGVRVACGRGAKGTGLCRATLEQADVAAGLVVPVDCPTRRAQGLNDAEGGIVRGGGADGRPHGDLVLWMAGRGRLQSNGTTCGSNDFPQAHIQIARINASTFSFIASSRCGTQASRSPSRTLRCWWSPTNAYPKADRAVPPWLPLPPGLRSPSRRPCR